MQYFTSIIWIILLNIEHSCSLKLIILLIMLLLEIRIRLLIKHYTVFCNNYKYHFKILSYYATGFAAFFCVSCKISQTLHTSSVSAVPALQQTLLFASATRCKTLKTVTFQNAFFFFHQPAEPPASLSLFQHHDLGSS